MTRIPVPPIERLDGGDMDPGAAARRDGHHRRTSRCWRLVAGSRWVVAAAVTLVAAVAAAGEASGCVPDTCAVYDGGAHILDGGTAEGWAFDWTSVRTGAARATPGSGSACAYRPFEFDHETYAEQFFDGDVFVDTRFYIAVCDTAPRVRFGMWTPGRGSADRSFHDVVQEAIDRLAPTRPLMRLAPAADQRHLTGVATWLALAPSSWHVEAMTVSAGEVAVEVVLTPLATVWSLGDGTTRRCAGPGRVYDRDQPSRAQQPSCSHTYLTVPAASLGPATSTYPLVARIVYGASYTLATPDGIDRRSLGEVAGPPATAPLLVEQYQAVRVRH